MARFHVTSPDGQTFEINAPDGATQDQVLAYARANAPKPSAARDFMGTVKGSVDKLVSDVRGDYQTQQSRLGKPLPGPMEAISQGAGDVGRTARLVGDAANVLFSPVSGAVNALVVQPGARMMDQIPLDAYDGPHLKAGDGGVSLTPARKLSPAEKHDANANIISTALSASRAMPGPPGLPATAVAPRTNALADTVSRFDRAGVDPILAAGGGKGAATMANVVAENPIAGAAVRGRLRNAVAQTDASAGRVAADYGETRGPQITGENVQAGVKAFAQDKNVPTSFAAKAGAKYDDVFDKLDTLMAGKTEPGRASAVVDDQFPGRVTVGGSQITTPATTAAIGSINDGVQSSSIAGLIRDPTLSKAAQALTDANAAKDMSFSDLRRLRTWVRAAKDNPELRQSIGSANLGKLEGALTQDIYTNAEALGSPDLAKQLRRTDQFYAAGQQRIQGALDKFASAKTGEGAYARVLQAAGSTSSADGRSLLALKRSLAPDEWGDVAANAVNEMGRQTAGAAPAGEPGFSVSSFVTNYNKLSPRGKDILFGSVGGGGSKASALRSELENLASVADNLKGVEKGANTSKTFVNSQAAGTLAGLVTPHMAGPTILALGGEALTGEALTNPLVVRWLARLGTAQQSNPAAVQSVVKQLGSVARTNAALAPLYRESLKMIAGPRPIAATAGAGTPDQPTAP